MGPLKRGERDRWATTRAVLAEFACPTTARFWAATEAIYAARERLGLHVIDEERPDDYQEELEVHVADRDQVVTPGP